MNNNRRFSLKNLRLILHNVRPYRLPCPNCMAKAGKNIDPYLNTVVIHYLWDEQYHKYKFYAHCRDCKYTTPAFPTTEEAESHVNMNWIQAEYEVLGIG